MSRLLIIPLLTLSLLLLGLFAEVTGAKAMTIKRVAGEVLYAHSKAYLTIANRTINPETRDKIQSQAICGANILKEENVNSKTQGDISDLSYWFAIDYLFYVIYEAESLLLDQSAKMKNKGKILLKKKLNAQGKTVARSLVSHGEVLLSFYKYQGFKNYSLDMCALDQRIEELGGSSPTNFQKAYSKMLEENQDYFNYLQQFLKNYDLDQTGEIWEKRIDKTVKIMRKLKFKEGRIALYRKSLIESALEPTEKYFLIQNSKNSLMNSLTKKDLLKIDPLQ